jgi:hypothetical protein
MNLVTLGHCAASFFASPVVTLRQLLSPKPSARASVIFFEPHHEGPPDDEAEAAVPVPVAAAGDALDALELELELEPQADRTTTHDTVTIVAMKRLQVMCMNLSNPSSRLLSFLGFWS